MNDEKRANDEGGPLDGMVRRLVEKRETVDKLMKRCQIGVGGRNALDEAHSIMADCYGTLGLLMLTVERMHSALQWIEGATSATPGLSEQELGRVMAHIAKRARADIDA